MIVAIGNLDREIVFAHHPALNELSATGYHNRLSPSNRSQRGTVRPAPLAGGIGPDERDLCGIGRAAVSRQDVAEPHVLVQGGLADPRQERLGATRNESPVEAANVSPLKQRQERSNRLPSGLARYSVHRMGRSQSSSSEITRSTTSGGA